MFIKLGIIAGIIILGGMVFSNEIDTLFPSTSAAVFDSLKEDASNFGSKASNSVEQRIDASIDKIVDKTTESISEEISEAGDKVTNEISEAKESSQKVIKEEISNFNPIESIQNIFTGGSNSKFKKNSFCYRRIGISQESGIPTFRIAQKTDYGEIMMLFKLATY